MRPRLLAALIASALCLSASPSVERVWGDYVPAENFERIREYFGKPEAHSGRIVLRTRPDDRSGYYFLIRMKDGASIPAGSRWLVQVLLPDSRKAVSFELPVQGSANTHQLGLTGADWPSPKTNPVAWKVSLLGPDGTTVLSHKSFLWD